MPQQNEKQRTEKDALGERTLPAAAYYGIHTTRARENFPLSGRSWPAPFITALAQVKLACARVNLALGCLPQDKGQAICRACEELTTPNGGLQQHIVVDPYQGGAGTSTNMNINEVLANRAIELLGGEKGDYALVHPIEHVNLHQSTNDVFPTALKTACLALLVQLEERAARLQDALQRKEHELRDVVCLGRTQLRDAVPMTLGMTFGAHSEGAARDRWRIFKCRERLKQVNLGGTALGTGLGAPRQFIFRAADELRTITGLPVSRAENLVDATQSQDCFAETAGILAAFAANLLKLSGDLRLLASGPAGGIGELELPPLQAGSSIMAGKTNPVLPEAVGQVALRVMAAQQTVTMAAGSGQLGLNQYMPLIALEMLEALGLLINVLPPLVEKCINGVRPREERITENLERSEALATALAPHIGYSRVEQVVLHARSHGLTVRDAALALGVADAATLDELLSPGRMRRLGHDLPETSAKTDGDDA